MKTSVKAKRGEFDRRALAGVTIERVYHYHQQAGGHPTPTLIPSFYERVELVTGGRGWIWGEDAWHEVLPGHLIWNKPGDLTISRSDFENPYHCLAVTLVTKKRLGHGMPRLSTVANMEEVLNFTDEVVKLFHNDAFDRNALGEYVLARLLFWVRLQQHQARQPEFPAPIQEALEYLEKNFARPCPIRDLARLAGWSVPHFHDAFRRYLQTTPHRILAKHRLRAARERLVSTSDPVKQIAIECGFSNASALVHTFRAEVGLTPNAYRKRYMRLVLERAG